MAYSLMFSESVEEQIKEALNYYDAFSVSLSLKFEEDLINIYALLRLHPFYYFNLNKQFRRIKLSDFPYQIVYSIIEEDNEVFIAALFHQRANQKM